MLNIYEQVDRNKKKSLAIIVLFVIFVSTASLVLSRALGYGVNLALLALILSGVMSLGSYYFSERIILSLSRAKPATKVKDFTFYSVAENISLAAQIPIPKLYVIEDTAVNAFATGRNPEHAVVVATRGLLDKLDRTELEGVLAHEISHIKNYDILVMSLVTVLVGVIILLSDWLLRASYFGGARRRSEKSQAGSAILIIGLLLALASPLIASIIKLAISRRREFLADASGVKITKFPPGLARALEKISNDNEPLEVANKATAHLFISNPLKKKHNAIGWFAGLFNTHPPIEERIKALKAMI